MKRIIGTMALSLIVLVFGAILQAQEGNPPAKGQFDSDRLIVFEAYLDYLELNFAQALSQGGDAASYEDRLDRVEELATILQREVLKADLLSFVDVRNDVNTISDTYWCMKAAIAKGEKVPLVRLVSTRRNGRPGADGKDENWASFKCKADLDGYYAAYLRMPDGKGHSKVSPAEMIEAVAALRQQIGWMERSRKWNTVPNNGREFVLDKAPVAFQ
jgi:hypothetical protein